MYVKDGATVLADSLRILGGILSRPVLSTNAKRLLTSCVFLSH